MSSEFSSDNGLIHEAVTRAVFSLVAKIDRDTARWTCIEPVEAKEGEFEPFLVEFLEPGGVFVDGEEMVKRAKKKGIFTGLRHAEAMLRNQEKIPADWRKHCLVFPEVWQGPSDHLYVFCLYWSGSRWFLNYFWLGSGFSSAYRLVASRKYLLE